jgi:hypothetical protein
MNAHITFDTFSLCAISSGEFYTFRLPEPGLWLDILPKVNAAGFNAISVYSHMALINPFPGVVDFDDYRALEPLYEAGRQQWLNTHTIGSSQARVRLAYGLFSVWV